MKKLNITVKIWLSVGVFATGYILATTLGQIQALKTEAVLREVAESHFPAAQGLQDADAAFQRVVKSFGDSVMTQDSSALDKAAEDGRTAMQGLERAANAPGLDPARTESYRTLSNGVRQYLVDARELYGSVLANPAAMTSEAQSRMRDLATKTDKLKTTLADSRSAAAADLQHSLSALREKSVFQRSLALGVFVTTILVSLIIVNLTIQRSITGPIRQVIHGVDRAAGQAKSASERMANAGETSANNAQEQAAYIQETSASLEEISCTTRANADRAVEADRLMQEARQTMSKASQTMSQLKYSMNEISESSRQVSAVLKSIDEIAFHTNILALNAAVEAARAGTAGSGFSVVADEVRSLAGRASEAAGRSAEIIEKTMSDVTHGVELAGSAFDAFQGVASRISSCSEMATQIAASSDEQAKGISHIGTAIVRMEKVTQMNAQSAQETASTAADLKVQMQHTSRFIDDLVGVVGLTAAR